MFRRFIVLAVTALFTGVLAACGNTDSWVEATPSTGWSAQYADAANSSYVHRAGAGTLRPDWTRSVKGSLGAQAALGSGSFMALNAQTDNGCSLMVWEAENKARQRWCTRLVQGGPASGPLFDGFDNVYVGQPGLMMSYPPTQWVRWRQLVIGMPTTPRILAHGQLLVVTHLGQVLVFDSQRGSVEGTALDLVPGIDPTDSQRGLADCQPARPRCPVAAAPAFSPASNLVVVGVWEPNTNGPVLTAMRYRPGQTPLLSRDWTSTAVGGGPIASPVLSADGQTVYVNGRDQRLWALKASDGTAKWSVPLEYLAQTPPSVSPNGLIVAGGGPDGKLMAVRDAGDRGEVVWSRADEAPLTTSSRAGANVAYTVTRDGGHGQALLVFNPADGRTVSRYPLPDATGWPVGVSIGHDGRVVTATSDGQVYSFAPA